MSTASEVLNNILKKPQPDVHMDSEPSTSRENSTNHHIKADENQKNTVKISGYPKFTREWEILKLFAQYGKIVKCLRFTPQCAFIKYLNENMAEKAINSDKNIIYGEFLKVEFAVLHETEYITLSREKDQIVEARTLDLNGTFDKQVDVIMSSIRLTREEVEQLPKLYDDVNRVLHEILPGCKAYPFGSITTGLGIKTSDADCFVDIPLELRCNNNQKVFVSKAKRQFMRFREIFAEVFAIPHASTPIVKFHHKPTKTNCDVSFKTPLGVQNSRLISFFLRTDDRLLNLFLLCKYWAKTQGLTAPGRLSNYSLTLMVIYYLQQIPNPILPSIESLQRNINCDCFIDGWNAGFDPNAFIQQKNNKSTVKELFVGFFKYYSNFDFQKYVVCPLLGEKIEKKAFLDPLNLPETFELYKINLNEDPRRNLRVNVPMCIQDPYELGRNVTSGVSDRIMFEIKEHFKWVWKTYETCSNDPENDDFLKEILTKGPKIKKQVCTPDYKIKFNEKLINVVKQNDWRSLFRYIMYNIFETIMLFELTKIEKTKNDEEFECEFFIIKPTFITWHRKEISKTYNYLNISFLEKQIKITEELIKGKKKISDIKNVDLEMTMKFHKKEKRCHVNFKWKQGNPNTYVELGSFFIRNLVLWYNHIIADTNKSLITPETDKMECEKSSTSESTPKSKDIVDVEKINT